MRPTPVFTYPGSKSHLAPWIVSLMPQHATYVEPFAGTLAVLSCKPRSQLEVINDLDGGLVNFFRVLRDRGDELIAKIELTPYAQEELELAQLHVRLDLTHDELECAREWWVLHTMTINSKSTSFDSRRNQTQAFRSRLRIMSERLESVVIRNEDAIHLIEQYDSPDTFLYCDPPYMPTTRTRDIYKCEMITTDQHKRFADACLSTKSSVLISGYPSEEYDAWFSGWDRLERRMISTLDVQSTKGKDVTECLWANYPLTKQLSLMM